MVLIVSFPLSALIFAIILAVVFLKKKKIVTIESKVYLVMVISSLIDSFSVTAIEFSIIGKTLADITPFHYKIIELSNKIDEMALSTLCVCLFLYLTFITVDNINKKKAIKIASILLLIEAIICIFLKVNVYPSNGILTVNGSFLILIYLVVGLSVLLSILMILTHIKKITSKYFPLIFVIVDFILSMIAFAIAPSLSMAIPLSVTVVNYLLFFTIENPDIDLIRDLRLARDKAIKSEQAKSEFLSSMSHELKTPLNAIIGLSQNNQRTLEEYDDDMKDINKSSIVLLDMVNNIINMNKVESNSIEIVKEEYSFKNLITEICINTQKRIGEKDIEFNQSIDISVPDMLYGDKGKVREIINNILTNAVKYTDSGNIDLIIKATNTDKISNIIIECKDTGRGIDSDHLSKLFEKFNRLESDKDSDIDGTGIGLALTKEFAEMMGGKIEVESKLNEGSSFKVFIPQEIVDNSSNNVEIL